MSKKFGRVAIIGRPNVGKSTLLNRILGEKFSITSSKPQTTRQAILGVKTTGSVQIAYVDTPGLHQNVPKTMNKVMNRSAWRSLSGVDVVIFLLSGVTWTEEEEWILQKLRHIETPIMLVLNKYDQWRQDSEALSQLESLGQKMSFAEILPVSAKTGYQVAALEECLAALMKPGEHEYGEEQKTDRDERFWASEVIREKLIRQLGQELPYVLTVTIDQWKEKSGILHISATIWVMKEGQKAIVIGQKGSRLKLVGQQARLELEKRFGAHIFLNLWVKVKSSWADDVRVLQHLE